MEEKMKKQVMDKLLDLYDWHVRLIPKDPTDEYYCGYVDAIAQAILDIGKLFGEGWDVKAQKRRPYKYEAYKRVMNYDTTENYWKKYPKPRSEVFPDHITLESYLAGILS